MSSALAPISRPAQDLLDIVADVTCTPLADLDPTDLLSSACTGLARLPGVDGAGAVHVGADGQARVVASTDALTGALLAGQVAQGDGPVSAALIADGPVVVDEDRPLGCGQESAARAAQVGVRAVAALPVAGEDRLHAVLVLVRRRSEASSGEWPISQLDVVTDALGATLTNLDALRSANELVVRLSDALAQQAPIEQAKGALAERHGVDLSEAFRMLRHYARRHRTPLRHAARSVLDGGSVHDVPVPGQRRGPGRARRSAAAAHGPEKILRTR